MRKVRPNSGRRAKPPAVQPDGRPGATRGPSRLLARDTLAGCPRGRWVVARDRPRRRIRRGGSGHAGLRVLRSANRRALDAVAVAGLWAELMAFTKDEILTNITLYWLTGTIGPAMRIYHADSVIPLAQHARRVEVPSDFSLLPGEPVH